MRASQIFGGGSDSDFTGTKSFAGTSSKLALVLVNAAEVVTVVASASTGVIPFYITTQSVLYYTLSATANWTLNFRASVGTTLNAALAIGQSVSMSFLATTGATAYLPTAFQVDGVVVTPKWQGGAAPTAGNASSIDAYTFTIIKTANATFTVLAAQTQYK